MKKIYAFFMMAIMAMVGLSASAASVTVTVKVNNPDYASILPYYSPGGTSITETLTFVDNQCEYSFPDGANFRYFKVTPVTPEGSATIYMTEYTIYDCDGSVVTQSTTPKDKMSYITVPVSADGGIIDIKFGTLEDKNVTFNVEGTLDKIQVSADGVNIPLVLGENVVALAATTSYITIRPQGVASLYSVTLNGTEIPVTVDGLEGSISYYYTVRNPADGDVINIVTDYPDKDCNVTFTCNFYDFVQTVKVNGEELDGWCPLTVKAGDLVEVQGDTYNYVVVSCGINDQTFEYASYEMSATITDDTEFKFEVAQIERSGNFVMYTNGGQWRLVNENQNYITLKEGYVTLGVDPATENPFSLQCIGLPEGASMESEFYVYINDVKQEESFFYTINIADGDVVKAYYGTSEPTAYNVTYTLEGVEGLPIIVKDKVTVVGNLDGHTALPGTIISITPAEGQRFSTVTVNGNEVYESWDGSYTFTVNDNSDVKISYVAAADKLITIKTNIPEGIIVRYAGEFDFELTSEETVVNLSDYDVDEWSNFIMVYPMPGFVLESVLYNGAECVGSEEYDFGGCVVVYEPQNGDVFNITVAQMVRDQEIMVYTSGLQNGYCVLTEVTGMTPLLDDMSNGYHQVNFATAEAPLQFQVLNKDNDADQVFVYLNDETVTYFFGYELYCQNGDVVKLYLQPAAPEVHTLEYTLNGGAKEDVVVKHDHIRVIEEPATHSVHFGTHVSIAPAEGKSINNVTVNGTAVAADEDGAYAFQVSENSTVAINFTSSLIDGIINDANGTQIYNLQGIRMTRDLNSLPAGVYIVNGKKIQVK